jgi:phage shock protein PspC (stress-responsive transcriptional regulator)
MEHTADIPSTKRLERPTTGRMFAGVCEGLGRYFDLSPTFYRLGFVILTLLGGAGLLVYLAAVLVIPAQDKESSIAAEALAERRDKPWPLIGLGLVGAAVAVLLARATLWPVAGGGWFLILLVGLGVLWASRGRTRGRIFVRVLVAAFVTLLVAAIAAFSIAIAWFDVSFSDGVGNQTYQPAAVSDLRPTYELGVGDLALNLTSLGPVTEPTTIHTKVGIGEIRITLPENLPVAVNAHAKVGQLDVLDQHHGGHDVSLSEQGSALLVIDAKVGAGRIHVERAPR